MQDSLFNTTLELPPLLQFSSLSAFHFDFISISLIRVVLNIIASASSWALSCLISHDCTKGIIIVNCDASHTSSHFFFFVSSPIYDILLLPVSANLLLMAGNRVKWRPRELLQSFPAKEELKKGLKNRALWWQSCYTMRVRLILGKKKTWDWTQNFSARARGFFFSWRRFWSYFLLKVLELTASGRRHRLTH